MIFIAGIMLVLGQGMVTAYYTTDWTTTTSDSGPGQADISGSVGPQRVKLCSENKHEDYCDNQTVIFHVDQWRENSNENSLSAFGEKISLPVTCKFKWHNWTDCPKPKPTTRPETTTDYWRGATGRTRRTTTRRGTGTTTQRGTGTTTQRVTGTTTRRGTGTTTTRETSGTTTKNTMMDCWKMTCRYAITHLDDIQVKAHATIYKPSGHWPVGKTQDLQDGRMKILGTTKYFGGSLDGHVRKDTEPNGFRISGKFKLTSQPMLAADEPPLKLDP